MTASALVLGIAIAGVAGQKDPIPDAQSVRSIVLVHGAFVDGSGWRGVYDELTARGYRVSIVQNPLTSLADDVAATRRVLARHKGPVMLVGHSYGGAVITEAGTDPRVAGLVYVSALAPDAGETGAEQFANFPPPPEFVIETQEDGFGFVGPDSFLAGFASDLDEADAAFLRDSQVPLNMAVFEDRIGVAAWREKPSWAVIATQDRAIDPRLLRAAAERIGAEIVEVEASHALFLTRPREVADAIDKAARAASR